MPSTSTINDVWQVWSAGTACTTSNNTNVWIKWSSGGSTCSTNAVTVDIDGIWRCWVQGTSNGTDTWGYWQTMPYQTIGTPLTTAGQVLIAHGTRPVETAEEREARLIREREEAERRAERYAAEKKQAEEALQRAKELLVQFLDEEQLRMFEKLEKFHVISQEGKRYEISLTGTTELEEDKPVRGFCIFQTGGTPKYDNMLAKKLMLEANEKEFLRIANKWDIQRAGERTPQRQAG